MWLLPLSPKVGIDAASEYAVLCEKNKIWHTSILIHIIITIITVRKM